MALLTDKQIRKLKPALHYVPWSSGWRLQAFFPVRSFGSRALLSASLAIRSLANRWSKEKSAGRQQPGCPHLARLPKTVWVLGEIAIRSDGKM